MRRTTAPLIVPLLATALAGLVCLPTAASARVADDLTTQQRTGFAFHAAGFGTKVVTGPVPGGSGKTAFNIINCTNLSGTVRRNFEAQVTVPGLGVAHGVSTRMFSSAKGSGPDGVYASTARQRIARLVLAENDLGSVAITAIRTQARTSHRDGRFHADTRISIGGISFTPTGGDPQAVDLPTPNQPVTIPGVATISLGRPVEKTNRDEAIALASALKVDVAATGTLATVSNARARLDRGVKAGLFHGYSAGVRAMAADDNIRVGRTPLRVMPCVGTDGKRERRSLASSDLGGGILVGAAEAVQRSNQTEKAAQGLERGRVARLQVGGDQLVVEGAYGQAYVKRVKGQGIVARKATGGVGTVTASGEEMTFPDSGVLEIPGVARLEQKVVDRSATGLEVIGVRVTLLDGTGAVLDLGVGRLQIRPGKG